MGRRARWNEMVLGVGGVGWVFWGGGDLSKPFVCY